MMGKRSWDQHFGEEACPRFIALAGDTFIEADNSLDWLLAALRRDVSGLGGDVVVWDDLATVAAVLRANGNVLRFDRPPRRKVRA